MKTKAISFFIENDGSEGFKSFLNNVNKDTGQQLRGIEGFYYGFRHTGKGLQFVIRSPLTLDPRKDKVLKFDKLVNLLLINKPLNYN